jgi:hypothetical protein
MTTPPPEYHLRPEKAISKRDEPVRQVDSFWIPPGGVRPAFYDIYILNFFTPV